MAVAKLPVLETVGRAYASIKTRAGALGAISGSWAIAAGVALAAGLALVLAAPENSAVRQLPAGEQAGAATSLATLTLLVALYIIVVKWHRLVIRRVSPAEVRRGSFGAAFLYLARGLLLGSIGALVVVVGGLLPVVLARQSLPADWQWQFAAASLTLALFVAFALLARICLILPAGAVGDLSVTPRKSWALTRGNTLRLMAGSALASGPVFFANAAANVLLRSAHATGTALVTMSVLTMLSLVLLIVAAVIQAGFLSYAYVFFTGYKGDAAETLG